jgi:hypothetical protein
MQSTLDIDYDIVRCRLSANNSQSNYLSTYIPILLIFLEAE